MIFLVQYNRSAGRLESIDEFCDEQRSLAEQKRLEMEIKNLNRRSAREIVLLEALTKDYLRHTHRRYFETVGQIVSDPDGLFADAT